MAHEIIYPTNELTITEKLLILTEARNELLIETGKEFCKLLENIIEDMEIPLRIKFDGDLYTIEGSDTYVTNDGALVLNFYGITLLD